MAAEVVNSDRYSPRPPKPVAESPFYIPMTGPAARPRRSLKHDDTFIVLDSHGDIGASAGGPDGLFNADTRYLARLELVLDDVQPLLLGSNLRDDNSALTVDLTNPDIYRDGRIVLQKDMLHIVRTIFLWRGTAYQRIGLQNHGDRTGELRPDAAVRQRFRRSVRSARRTAPAPRRRLEQAARARPTSLLEYRGLDGKSRITALHFDPRPTRLAVNAATYHFELAPQQVDLAVRRGVLQQAGRCTSRRRSSAACWRIAARCGARPRARPASKPRTTSSTRCCASRWPTSTC